MHLEGEGVKQDSAAAVEWYRKAAEGGHVDSQFNLGVMCETGEGVEQDMAEAAKWYRKAAAQGNEDAAKRLRELGF